MVVQRLYFYNNIKNILRLAQRVVSKNHFLTIKNQ